MSAKNFFTTCRNVYLEGTILHAEHHDLDNKWMPSKLYLDRILGNADGKFEWMGQNFHLSASDVRLEGAMLHANLMNLEGVYVAASVDLNEFIDVIDSVLTCRIGPSSYTRRGQSKVADGNFCWTWKGFLRAETRKQEDFNSIAKMKIKKASMETLLSPQTEYIYTPLPRRRSIRLVQIAPPTSERDHVHCSIKGFDLDEAPPFAALSYTWGNPRPYSIPEIEESYQIPIAISCDGKRMKVSQSLYEALVRLRHSSLEEPQWHFNKTELIFRAEEGHIVDVEVLLRKGANVHARDVIGKTALHYAAENGYILVVKALVYAGSDVSAVDQRGRTPLDCAKQKMQRCWDQVISFLTRQQSKKTVFSRERSFLRRKVTQIEYFWIDAICINQYDNQEKANQVSMMGDIYRTAKTVVVWLGHTYDHKADATLKLLQCCWMLEDARTGVGTYIQETTIDRMLKLFDTEVPWDVPIDESDHVALAVRDWINTAICNNSFSVWNLGISLLRSRWFSRAWILQEVIMARDIDVVCGPYIVPWDILIFMAGYVQEMSSSLRFNRYWQKRVVGIYLITGPEGIPTPTDLERRRKYYNTHGKLPMLNALFLTRNSVALNPRDKIFSALSFATINQPTAAGIEPIKPDYTQPTKLLYTNIAKALILTHGPSVLSLAGLQRPQNSHLQSWIPDFQVPLRAQVCGIDLENINEPSPSSILHITTASNLKTELVEITHKDQLLIHGHIFSTITEVAQPNLHTAGPDLAVLESWVRILSNANIPLPERAKVLSRVLLEDDLSSQASSEPASDTEETFHDWLMFLSFTSVFDLTGWAFNCVRVYGILSLQASSKRAIIAQNGRRVPRLLRKANSLFASLNLPFSLNACIPRTFHMPKRPNPIDFHDLLAKAQLVEKIDKDTDLWWIWEHMAPLAEAFGDRVHKRNTSRRLVRAGEMMVGTAPEWARVGDAVVAVKGAKVMYVLRRISTSDDGGAWRLVGEIFLYGVHVEEVLKEAEMERELDRICIC